MQAFFSSIGNGEFFRNDKKYSFLFREFTAPAISITDFLRREGPEICSPHAAKEMFETILLNFYFLQLRRDMSEKLEVSPKTIIRCMVNLFESCLSLVVIAYYNQPICFCSREPCYKMNCIFCYIFLFILITVKTYGEAYLSKGVPRPLNNIARRLKNKHCGLCCALTKPEFGFVVTKCKHLFCTECYILWRIGDGFRS